MKLEYEPFSERVRTDPYPYYRELREHAPVYWAPEAGTWVVSRYEDVSFVLKHHELFSSDAMGGMLAGQPVVEPRPASLDRILILMDPPDHVGVRNLVSRGFTPNRIAAVEARLREIVAETMTPLRDAESFDLVSALAVPVPVTIIAELLGVEIERSEDFKQWSDDIVAGVTGSRRSVGVPDQDFGGAMGQFEAYFGKLMEKRRSDPREDLISALTQAQDGEVGLNQSEMLVFLLTLLIAGNETTTNLIGSMVEALYEHPEQLERVVRDRSLIPSLIEETLRYAPPVQFLCRRTRCELELAGTKLPKNSAVLPLLASANRDDRQFERGDEFDLTRDASGHLSFGFGTHICMGAALARLEANIIAEALIEELPRFRPSSEPLEYVDSFMMRGPRKLVLERCSASSARATRRPLAEAR